MCSRAKIAVFLFVAMALFPGIAFTAIVELGLERCRKPSGATTATHSCEEIETKLINLRAKRVPAQNLLANGVKKRMFRHEMQFGQHQIKIGAWKEDPLKPMTVLNISLFEEGRGQIDYNEVSFYDDKSDNYFSIALRPRSNTEFYRLQLHQSMKPKSRKLNESDTF